MEFEKRKKVRVNNVRMLIIDEADSIIDLGFFPELERIEKMRELSQEERQTVLVTTSVTPEILDTAKSERNYQ